MAYAGGTIECPGEALRSGSSPSRICPARGKPPQGTAPAVPAAPN
jgi:hypothetical protein